MQPSRGRLSRALLALALALFTIAPAAPTLAADCALKLGFRALAEQVPEVVGTCLEDEHFNLANGNSEQRTTAHHGKGGLLVWRKTDNWTAFTDGYWTWVNGPSGVMRRLNTERFDWEAPPPPPPPAPSPPAQAAPVRPGPAPIVAAPGPAACSVVLPGREFGAVFLASGAVRPVCETWARALVGRLRASQTEGDWCARIRVPKGMTDDTCRFLRSLGGAEAAVSDQSTARGVLVCSGDVNGVRFAVLDTDQQQIGGLFCTVLEDSGVKTIRS